MKALGSLSCLLLPAQALVAVVRSARKAKSRTAAPREESQGQEEVLLRVPRMQR